MDVYKKDHKDHGIIMWMCFLQEYAGSPCEIIIAVEEVLHPRMLKLENFKHNIKDFTIYSHENMKTFARFRQPKTKS